MGAVTGEEKRNRIVAAVTVNAIILIFIIVAVLIYQIVAISALNSHKKELLTELAALKAELAAGEDFLDRYNTDEQFRLIVDELVQLGYDRDDLLQGVDVPQ